MTQQQPLFVETVTISPHCSLPIVFYKGRQWVPLEKLARRIDLKPADLVALAQDASLAQSNLVTLALAGQTDGTLCINRTDLPLLMERIPRGKYSPALHDLWKAQSDGRLTRDAAANELYLMNAEVVH